jgi:hypothetical protein
MRCSVQRLVSLVQSPLTGCRLQTGSLCLTSDGSVIVFIGGQAVLAVSFSDAPAEPAAKEAGTCASQTAAVTHAASCWR